MASDPHARDISESWATVRDAQALITRHLNMASGPLGLVSHELRNVAYAMVLVFAYSVLEDALESLDTDGRFSGGVSGRPGLRRLMQRSRSHLTWKDYDEIAAGKRVRDAIAHRRVYPERGISWQYIDAIEAELLSWGLIDSS